MKKIVVTINLSTIAYAALAVIALSKCKKSIKIERLEGEK